MKQREVKFRVWNEKFGMFMASYMNNLFMNFETGLLTIKEKTENHSDYILMQFTGVKDTKRKDIYEGDVLKTKHGEHMMVFFNSSTGSWDVAFSGGDSEPLIGEDGWEYDLKQYGYTIAGNIYQNGLFAHFRAIGKK